MKEYIKICIKHLVRTEKLPMSFLQELERRSDFRRSEIDILLSALSFLTSIISKRTREAEIFFLTT